jgi:hypothetical protein
VWQVVWWEVVCGQVVCEHKLWREVATGGGGQEAADGMQNQKQEPHTKMWGTKNKKNMKRIEQVESGT